MRRSARQNEAGFSLPELLVSTTILMVISSVVMAGLMQMIKVQKTITNRTDMHGGVRSATELLQQEVGQAGRVALPAAVTLTAAVAAGAQTVTVSSTSGMFVGEQLVVDTGGNVETVVLTAINAGTNTVTANSSTGSTGFFNAHASAAPVTVYGGFSSGIVPTNMANGSSGTVLKMYGDINSDGNMLYVEYTCDTNAGNLYRNSIAWNAASKPAVTSSQTLLENIRPNPGGGACFTYEQQTVGANTYVTNVAITLTVQSQVVDPITKQFQTETKALLNVAPRNVFNVWELASQGSLNRVQPMPPSITNLLS